ncbi:MAG: glycosyltransferase family 4 protein [Phycisphaerae bacterium]
MTTRITFLAHHTASRRVGGADRSLLALLSGLSDAWVPHVILPHDGALKSALAERGVATTVVPYRNATFAPREGAAGAMRNIASRTRIGGAQAVGARRVMRAIRQISPDIVYSNSAVLSVGALAASRLGLAHIWHIREFPDPGRGIVPWCGWGLHRRLMRRSAACIAITRSVREATLAGLPDERVHVIYNGILPWQEFVKHRRAPLEPAAGRPFTFLVLGGLCAAKGQDQAIRALAKVAAVHPDVRLLVVGGGDAGPLEALAREKGVADRVEFWGGVPQPWPAFDQSDCTLMCSVWEPMGRVTVESMAAGVPVIGRASGGTLELIEDNETGLLYDGSGDGLVARMRQMISQPGLGASLAQRAWEVAQDRYSIEGYAQRVERVLLGVAQRQMSRDLRAAEARV